MYHHFHSLRFLSTCIAWEQEVIVPYYPYFANPIKPNEKDKNYDLLSLAHQLYIIMFVIYDLSRWLNFTAQFFSKKKKKPSQLKNKNSEFIFFLNLDYY